jgi:ABC-2 type transport system permease protein
MAGLSAVVAPQARVRGQFAAIAYVRWRLFVNSLRTVSGRLELVAHGFMFFGFAMLGLGGSLAMGAAAWYFVSRGRVELLATLLWPIFFFWQFFPVVATAFTETMDSSNLLRFPLTFRSYFLIRIAYGAMDPSTAVGCLWIAGIAAGTAVAGFHYFALALPVLLLFAAFNILLSQMIYTWVERWLARRRSREILGFVFLLFIISFQFIGPLASHYGRKARREVAQVTGQALPVERLLPPGLAASSIAQSAQGNYAAGAAAFTVECGYALVVLWLLNLRLRAQYSGENLSEAIARQPKAIGKQREHLGWNVFGAPASISAMVEKEFHYLSRSGPMLFTLIMPVVILLIFRMTPGRTGNAGGIFSRATDLAFPVGAAYSLLVLTNLIYNSLGADGSGIQFYFVCPVRFRDILIGKNLAHALVMALDLGLVWVATSIFYRPPDWDIALATVTGVLFALLVNLTAGNLLSIYTPKKIDFGTFGRQRASGATAFASLGIQAVVTGLCALAILTARAYDRIWLAALVFLFLAGIAAIVYIVVSERMDAIAFKRREALITELCKAQ